MPIYEYECASCGRRVEVIHGIHSPGPTTCDACGGQLRKVLSAPAIVFKGSGWAKKDARASSAPAKPTDSTDSTKEKPAADASAASKGSTGDSGSSGGSTSSSASSSTSGGGDAGTTGD
jgi:putative FmdB family regulatory protein